MTIRIYVTNKKCGESILYEKREKRGREKSVPLYEMHVLNESGTHALFEVTRDTVEIFKEPHTSAPHPQYGIGMECPPHKPSFPYHANIRTDGDKGFRIQLFEPRIGNATSIQGKGDTVRTHIQIHIGPRSSEGCILLSGDEEGRNTFQQCIFTALSEDKKHKVLHPDKIYVYVQERISPAQRT